MKRNWLVIAVMFLLTAALWAQAASTTPKADTKTTGCACCNRDMKDMTSDAKGHDHAAMHGAAVSGCCGKDAKACSRKDAKGGCCDGMKKDAKATTTASNEKPAAAGCGKDCCGKDCCKDGKCEMAKNGKKCCANCAGMAEGK